MSDSASASASSLTCTQILAPPNRHLGTTTPANKHHYALTFLPRQPAWQCSFSRDGLLLAVAYGAPDPVVRIFYFLDGKWHLQSTLSSMHSKTVRSVAFAPLLNSYYILASASFDGTIAIWEPDNTTSHTSGAIASPSSSSLSSMNWISTAQLEGHDTECKCVTWNGTGSLLATCGRDKSVWIWECYLSGTVGGSAGGDFECLAVLNGHQGDVKAVVFCDSHGEWGDADEILLSCGYDDCIKIWACSSGDRDDWYCAATLSGVHASTIWCCAVSPSATRLVAGSQDGSVSIYKCYTRQEKKRKIQQEPAVDDDKDNVDEDPTRGLWKCVCVLNETHGHEPVYGVSYASAAAEHGRIATCGGDNRIVILKETSDSSLLDRPLFQKEVDVTTDHGDVLHVQWHPINGHVLASCGDDGLVRLWYFGIS